MKSVCERQATTLTDTRYRKPFVGVGCGDSRDASEPLQECMCSHRRDTRNGGENGRPHVVVGTLRDLSESRPIPMFACLDPVAEANQPARRVLLGLRSQNGNPLLDRCDAGAPDCIGVNWSVCKVRSLDQKHRPRRVLPESANLSPEAAVHEREMEIAHALALDEHPTAHLIVSSRERTQLNTSAERGEHLRDPGGPLVDIHTDPQRLHTESVGLDSVRFSSASATAKAL